MYKIAIFASGVGSNALNIIKFFRHSNSVVVDSVWSNNKDAPVLHSARAEGVEAFYFSRAEFNDKDGVYNKLRQRDIDLIVLAGFLWLVPEQFIRKFRFVNIHPSLLPKYGGKGMYGLKVHEAVIANNEKQSGITIHMVDQEFDSGRVILQKQIEIAADETPQSLQQKIHQLEYEYYPQTIADIIKEG